MVEKALERIVLSRNWGSGIAVPHRNKGKGKNTTRAKQDSAQRDHDRKPSGREAGNGERDPNTQPGQEPENITLEENEKRRGGRDREEVDDTQLDPNLPGQEEVHGEEKPQNDQELEQEVEVTTEATTEVVKPEGNVLLNTRQLTRTTSA